MAKEALRTVHFVSLGCPKNRVDTEVMAGVADAAGLSLVGEAEGADVVVINTCGFIGEAKKESIDAILEAAELRTAGQLKKLVVAGCLSQRYASELAKEIPEVDHFMGSSDMLKLRDVLGGEADRMLVGNPAQWVIHKENPRALSQGRHFAYVKIAEGCNRSCSFCVIPEMRGKQRSRSIADVKSEVTRLVSEGVVEINLISQDTVSYGRDLPGSGGAFEDAPGRKLAELVEAVADVKGVRWVRLFYLYPETLDPKLIELLGEHPRVLPYVDMPLQHASDAMLKRMKRGHGIDRQKRVVDKLRKAVPDLTFRTAFIVGHPGETDRDFEELVDFVKWAEFERMAAFRYSDEESSASFSQSEKVPAKTAASRYRALMKTQKSIAHKKSKALIGRELEVLIEGQSDEHEYVQMARHAGQAPEIDGQVYLEGPEVEDARVGEIRRVIVTQAADYDVVGELMPRSADETKAEAHRRRALEKIASKPRARVMLPVIGDIEGR